MVSIGKMDGWSGMFGAICLQGCVLMPNWNDKMGYGIRTVVLPFPFSFRLHWSSSREIIVIESCYSFFNWVLN